ncbi:MAG TPA: aminoacyltransferase [Bacilli bacterium]|nr:aminoacyltransferase [Bacilli bacterium]
MKFCELSDQEFEKFALNHEQSNFFQSLYMKELLIKENREVYLLGLKDDKDNVIAATLLASSNSFMGKKTFEALKGFLIDYSNEELVLTFTNYIKKFINEHNGFRLTIDPYIVFKQRDTDANIIKDGIDNSFVKDYLLKNGFKEMKNSAQVKWTYVLDIDGKSSEELLKLCRSNTRNYINRTMNKYKLVMEELPYEKLDVFKKITQDTCDRRGFHDRSLEYYQNMYKIFKDKLKVLVTKLDCNLYIKTLEDKKNGYLDKIKNLSDSASNKKKKEIMKKDITSIDKKIEEVNLLKQEHGEYIILSGAMFVLYGNEIVYLFSGSYDEYMKYCGQYRLQWEMIKYAADNNYKRYNFYGIKDVFDKNGKDYGVYEFKKGFNGYVEELFGAYETGTNLTYRIYSLLKSIKNIGK